MKIEYYERNCIHKPWVASLNGTVIGFYQTETDAKKWAPRKLKQKRL